MRYVYLNELSAQEAESEQSSILNSDELEFRQYLSISLPNQTRSLLLIHQAFVAIV